METWQESSLPAILGSYFISVVALQGTVILDI